jgi:hypothetical protein
MSSEKAVKAYTTNRICCLTTSVLRTDRLLKYGNESALCCLTKDFVAQSFLEMLQCSPISSSLTWYKAVLKLQYSEPEPLEYEYDVPLIIVDAGLPFVSFDGNQSTDPISFSGNYGILDDMEAVVEQLAIVMNDFLQDTGSSTLFGNAVVDSDDPTCVLVTIYHDSSWGDVDHIPVIPDITSSDIPLDSTLTTLSYAEDSSVTRAGCLSEQQMCNMKEYLDRYCRSC